MQAYNRLLPEWFNRVRSRQLTLPRFQRSPAWNHQQVAGLITTVLRGLPAGATLVLEVGEKEQFKSRSLVDAPKDGGKAVEQLLDGQQRISALWRAMHDTYSKRTYFVNLKDALGDALPAVTSIACRPQNGVRYPKWVDDPQACWTRDLVPVRLLRPEDINREISEWIKFVIEDDDTNKLERYQEIRNAIDSLRTKVREFNLPYLALPASTSRNIALDVFVKMNTSSTRLSTYDIIVALVEEETGKSFEKRIRILEQDVPRAKEYAAVKKLALDTVALMQRCTSSASGHRQIDCTRMIREWRSVIDGINAMVGFLESQSIFDAKRLPSYSALPVVAAIWMHLPTQPDRRGNALRLMRKYVWRAFLTERYRRSANTRPLKDFLGLKDILSNGAEEAAAPILDSESDLQPTRDRLLKAAWPKQRTILGRGLLALMLKCGADDFADGTRVSSSTIDKREYHHLFPKAMLSDAGIIGDAASPALNCALIAPRTNRTLSSKDPIQYLKERSGSSTLGEKELRRRLKTHLIPYYELAVGYDGMEDDGRRAKLIADFNHFLDARARILEEAARYACDGRTLEPGELVRD